MYERKIPEDLECGINITSKLLGGKGKPCIIDAVNRGINRPSNLHTEIASANPRVINMQLRELEQYGVVCKKIFTGLPLKVECYLKTFGQSLLPITDAMNSRGEENREFIIQSTREHQDER